MTTGWNVPLLNRTDSWYRLRCRLEPNVAAESFAVFRDTQPLAIVIEAAILLRLPALDRQVLRSALRQHTGSTRYLKMLQSARLFR
jgi:ProP effector